MNITFLYTQFKRAATWNMVEAIIYQALLVTHQLFLFATVAPSVYGLIGTIFSLVYAIATIGNSGLDNSLAPFFMQLSSCRKHFRAIVLPQLVISVLTYAALMVVAYYIKDIFLPFSIPFYLYIILTLLVISEGLKKTLRSIAQLAFLNHVTAPIELAGIVCYLSLVWIPFHAGLPITLYSLFIPMLFISLSTTGVLGYSLSHWYKSLSEETDRYKEVPWKRIIISRILTSVHSMGHLVFSGNILIPVFAHQFGLVKAGTFKLITTIAYSAGTIIQKIFGLTTDAVFSRLKETNHELKREAFVALTNKLYYLVFGIGLSLLFHYRYITHAHPSPENMVVYLLLLLILSEYLFLTYEKFYIVHEGTSLLLFLHGFVVLSSVALVMSASYFLLTPVALTAGLLGLRVTSLGFLGTISFFQWRLQPIDRFTTAYLGLAFIISFIFFLWA